MPTAAILRTLRTLVLYAAVLIVVYVLVNAWRKPVVPDEIILPSLDVQGTSFVINQDTPTLIYFWGSWCRMCDLTTPVVERLHQSRPDSVVGIAVASGDDTAVQRYLLQHGVTMPTLNDPNGAVFDSWQAQVTPSYVLITSNGRTQGMTGYQPLWLLRLRLYLANLS